MPEIEPIKIYNLNINNLNIPKARVFDIPPPVVNNLFVPVTVDIGNPIIEIPGCVKDHPDGDDQLTIDDPKGTKILCTNEYPSYDAMDYTPEDLVYQQEAPVPPTNIAEPPTTPEVPTDAIPQTKKEEIECPGPNAPRIGDVAQNQKERVSGFELQNGVCVTLYEDIPWQSQYLPAPQIAATTAGIAVVATSSALLAKPLADLLLKVFKPAIKKIMTKISKLRGKKVPILSSRDRQDLQRERSQAIRNLRKMTKG